MLDKLSTFLSMPRRPAHITRRLPQYPKELFCHRSLKMSIGQVVLPFLLRASNFLLNLCRFPPYCHPPLVYDAFDSIATPPLAYVYTAAPSHSRHSRLPFYHPGSTNHSSHRQSISSLPALSHRTFTVHSPAFVPTPPQVSTALKHHPPPQWSASPPTPPWLLRRPIAAGMPTATRPLQSSLASLVSSSACCKCTSAGKA